MPDRPTHEDEEIYLSRIDQLAKRNAFLCYCLMGVGLFTGIFWLIGAIWAMVKRSDFRGSLFEDHFSKIISMFWWVLGLSIIGVILSTVLVGYFLLFVVWIWSIYRIVRGLAKLTSNMPYDS